MTKGSSELYIASMAKQVGDIFIEGTKDDLTFYKMEGKYYVRMKSSLTAKKFWRRKAFERSRESCKRFSEGNKLASKLYRMIEEGKREYKLFCFLKKRTFVLLKEGKSLIKAENILKDYLEEFGFLMRDRIETPQNESAIELYVKGYADGRVVTVKLNRRIKIFCEDNSTTTPISQQVKICCRKKTVAFFLIA